MGRIVIVIILRGGLMRFIVYVDNMCSSTCALYKEVCMTTWPNLIIFVDLYFKEYIDKNCEIFAICNFFRRFTLYIQETIFKDLIEFLCEDL